MEDSSYENPPREVKSRGKKSSFIAVTFDVTGLHWYPGAAEERCLDDVKFLAHPHRHVFKFKVMVDVKHDERDIEFLQFQTLCMASVHNMDGDYPGTECDLSQYNVDVVFGPLSCETIASRLIEDLLDQFGDDYFQVVQVEVFEDGENGAIVRWTRN